MRVEKLKYNNNKKGGKRMPRDANTLNVHREEHRVLSNLKQKQCPILYLQSSSGRPTPLQRQSSGSGQMTCPREDTHVNSLFVSGCAIPV